MFAAPVPFILVSRCLHECTCKSVSRLWWSALSPAHTHLRTNLEYRLFLFFLGWKCGFHRYCEWALRWLAPAMAVKCPNQRSLWHNAFALSLASDSGEDVSFGTCRFGVFEIGCLVCVFTCQGHTVFFVFLFFFSLSTLLICVRINGDHLRPAASVLKR